ncbi:MAG: putative carboxymethylenebutenolidase [Gemmatimonadetes bacterium]|nr:putative carboxymethylenebutenolidase [Gemmatimonadota bacterium]
MRRTFAVLLAASAALSACHRQKTMPRNEADAAHLDAMSHAHAAETPAPNASVAEPRRPVTAAEVVYGTVDGRQVRGYLARPADAAPGAALPGIVVIHEWWGLNDNVRMMTRRLAGEGYSALAVDLYGSAAATPEQARGLMGGVMANPAAAVSNLGEALKYLRAQGAPKIGTVGWCFGGGWSLETALHYPGQVQATVMYYGRPVTDRARLAVLRAPVLGLFGEQDQGIPVDTVRAMEAAMHALDKDVELVVYPGAGHAFANPSGQAYRPISAADAWRRTVFFFNQQLKGHQ